MIHEGKFAQYHTVKTYFMSNINNLTPNLSLKLTLYSHSQIACTPCKHCTVYCRNIENAHLTCHARSTCFTRTSYSICYIRATHCNAVAANICYSSNGSGTAVSTVSPEGTVWCTLTADNYAVTQTRWWRPGYCRASHRHITRSHRNTYRRRNIDTQTMKKLCYTYYTWEMHGSLWWFRDMDCSDLLLHLCITKFTEYYITRQCLPQSSDAT